MFLLTLLSPHILILTSEVIWFKLRPLNITTILSPQEWVISFNKKECTFRNRKEDELGKCLIEGVLWREGHLFPNETLEALAKNIMKTNLPCVNEPKVTLKCMDANLTMKECLDNPILSPHCKFELIPATELQPKPPCVIKLPNYHGGLGKWMVRTDHELKNVMNQEHKIQWGNQIVARGFLSKSPFISETFVVEPFVHGEDLRIFAFRERPSRTYQFKTLKRVVKEGEWLANKHTKSFRVFNGCEDHFKELCIEAIKILHEPDLIAIDLIKGKNDISLLEIHNDVPGLYSLESSRDFKIHDTLLHNLEYLIKS